MIKRISLFLISVFLLLNSSCSKPEEAKDHGGKLRIGIFHKPTEINPITTASSISADLLQLLFNTLVRLKADGTISPEIAKQWEVSPDGLTWTFHLRDDIRFHDGISLTANDIKFTYDAIRATRTVAGYYTNLIKYIHEIRILDPNTIQIFLSQSDSFLWVALSTFPIAPKRLLENDPGYFAFNRHPIGSGPYKFIKQDEKQIVLEANENYFEGRPYLDQIAIEILPDQKTNLTHIIAGKIDVIFLLNPEDFGTLPKIPTIKIYDNWRPILYMLALNLRNDLFAASKVREALNYAINKQLIIDRVLKGKGVVSAGTFPPESKDLNPEVFPYPYQPDLTLQILQKRGWQVRGKDYVLENEGRRFEFNVLTIEGDDLNSKILQQMQEQLRQIGIKMNIEPLSLSEQANRVIRKRDFESTLLYSRLSSDINFSFWHSSQMREGVNFSSYSNQKVDTLLERARLSLDLSTQRNLLLELQRTLHDDPPGVFLFWRKMPSAIHKRFRGVPEEDMEMRDLIHVWIPKEEQKQ